MGNANLGNSYYVEMNCTKESAAGQANGQYDIWLVSATSLVTLAHYTVMNVTYIKGAGNALGWYSALYDMAYGGGTHNPNGPNIYQDIDEVFMAVS